MALLGVAAAPLILHSLAVPDEILHSTGIYLRITFLGAPFTFFYNALAAGLLAAGMDVFLVGPLPTPAISFLTTNMRADVGVVISASHNPFSDNGIKFFDAEGSRSRMPMKIA